jgi:hypothetical protein
MNKNNFNLNAICKKSQTSNQAKPLHHKIETLIKVLKLKNKL